jgi:hypothetical protein
MSFHDLIAHIFCALNNILLSGWTTAVYPLTYKCGLNCIQVLTIAKKAAVNIPVQVFVYISFQLT